MFWQPAGLPSRILRFFPYKWEKRTGKVRFEKIDLNNDLDALKKLLAGRKTDPCRRILPPKVWSGRAGFIPITG